MGQDGTLQLLVHMTGLACPHSKSLFGALGVLVQAEHSACWFSEVCSSAVTFKPMSSFNSPSFIVTASTNVGLWVVLEIILHTTL